MNLCVMKSVFFLLVFVSVSMTLQAQTWDEWFRQKKTQIQYLTQQIAGLQLYSGYLNQGYKIAKFGLNTIGKIKDGEFSLHQSFIASLSKVNPHIQSDYRIAGIIALQLDIDQQYHKCLKIITNSDLISNEELQYIHLVFDKLMSRCAKDISDVTSIITDNQLQLSDDERLKRVEVIYDDMKDKSQFSQSFIAGVNHLSINRQKARSEVQAAKQMFNLK